MAVAYLAAKAAVTGGLLESATEVPRAENPIARLGFVQRLPVVLGMFGYAAGRFLVPLGLSPDYSARSFLVLHRALVAARIRGRRYG